MKPMYLILIALVVIAAAVLAAASCSSPATKGEVPDIPLAGEREIPPIDKTRPMVTETADFGLGWFWGSDSRFGSIKGVVSTRVGYAGGTTIDADYYHIGDHTETVRVVYDPARVSYEELLEVFWAGHDATYRSYSMQYRSVILFHNEEQRMKAESVLALMEEKLGRKVYTDIVPATEFYTAEDYHQKYYLQGSSGLKAELRAIYPNFDEFVDSMASARINGYLGGFGTQEQLEEELDSLGLSQKGKETVLELAEIGLRPACSVPVYQ